MERQARVAGLCYLLVIAGGLFPVGFGLSLLFFAGFCVLVGALILSPALSDRLLPGILLPPFVGELSLALWLLVKGVRPQARLPRPAASQASWRRPVSRPTRGGTGAWPGGPRPSRRARRSPTAG